MTVLRAIYWGLGFLVIFASGYLLRGHGKPYGTALLTVHKLVALAVGVLVVAAAVRAGKTLALSSPELVAAVVTGLLFLATIVAGGLLATGKPMPVILSVAHRVLPYLSAATTAVTFYMVMRRRQR